MIWRNSSIVFNYWLAINYWLVWHYVKLFIADCC